jgi:hypothetical protein
VAIDPSEASVASVLLLPVPAFSTTNVVLLVVALGR